MNSIVFEKSKKFSLRIIGLYKYLCDEKKEYVLSKQLLRSGTSIGANIAEANCAISKKDFLAKMYIAFKESSETAYWLELLYGAEYLSKAEFDSINSDCTELQKILSSITKTTKDNS
ncbi:MAG: four helix bundle protein [Eubacteriales bacterium]|nr:four helix bundle protein [Eubacteriales bacterium]